MELLAGLGIIGSYIANNDVKSGENAHTNAVKRQEINGNNVYNSNNITGKKRKFKKRASDRYKQSRNPEETGVIPAYYNQVQSVQKRKKENVTRGRMRERMERRQQALNEGFGEDDSVFSDDMSSFASSRYKGNSSRHRSNSVDLGDPMAFFKQKEKMENTKKHEQKYLNKINNNGLGGFSEQFNDLTFDNPGDPVSANNVGMGTGNMSRIEAERNMALEGNYSTFTKNQDMTYGLIPEDQMTHNNMVPYFNTGFGKGHEYDSPLNDTLNNQKQRKVELFTGSVNNPQYRPKTERRPLFNPQVGLTHIYGMPNFTDYLETRYIPGRERRNEFVHQPVRITPGLNLNYNTVSKQGFQDTYRVLPKNVDQLRAANNPKLEYGSVVIPGMKGHRRGTMPNVAKRAPVTFKENDPRDLVKSMSYYRAPSIYGNYDAPLTNRTQTSKFWTPGAKHDSTVHLPQSMYEKVHVPHRENFEMPVPRNVTGVEREKNTSNTQGTYYVPQTNRTTTQENTYLNPAASEYTKGHAFDMVTNIPDPTLRNLMENVTQLNPGALHEGQKGGYHAEQSGTIAPITMKQTTQNNTYQQPANHHESQRGGYHAEQPGVTAPTTWRQLTQNNTYQQPAGDAEAQKGGYHAEQAGVIAPTTLRQLTQLVTRLNNVSQHEAQKGGYQAEQAGTTAPTTLRQLTQFVQQLNPTGHVEGQKGGYHAEQAGVIAPNTLRQLTQLVSQLNPAGHVEGQKGGYHAEQAGTFAPDTLRQLTQFVQQLNPIGHVDAQRGGYHVAEAGTTAPNTLRQLTQDTKQLGPAGLHEGAKGGYQAEQKGVTAPNTLRQLTQDKTQLNPAYHHEKTLGGYIAEQAGVNAPTTLRQLTQHKTQYNPAGLHEGQKGGYQAAQAGTTAPTTLRQLTQHKSQNNPAYQHEGARQRTRSDARNSIVNVAKDELTIVRDGGAPTTSNYDKGPTLDYSMVQLNEPIQINRDVYPEMEWQNPLQCVPTMHTKHANILPQQSWRFDTCVVSNLTSNPFINNTQHRSVSY